MSNEEFLQKLDETFQALTSLHQSGQLSEASYFKALVALAYEYACSGATDTCVRVLTIVSPEYFFGGECERQQIEDSFFYEVCTSLADWLVKLGAVTLDVDKGMFPFGFPQAPADA